MNFNQTKREVIEIINQCLVKLEATEETDKNVYCECTKSEMLLDPYQQLIQIMSEDGQKCYKLIMEQMDIKKEEKQTVNKGQCCCNGECKD